MPAPSVVVVSKADAMALCKPFDTVLPALEIVTVYHPERQKWGGGIR